MVAAAGREPATETQEGRHPAHPGPARPADSVRQWSARGDTHKHKRGREGAAGTAREGGLPTSDPADGGHMAAASQIKRLRLGGSAITAV